MSPSRVVNASNARESSGQEKTKSQGSVPNLGEDVFISATLFHRVYAKLLVFVIPISL